MGKPKNSFWLMVGMLLIAGSPAHATSSGAQSGSLERSQVRTVLDAPAPTGNSAREAHEPRNAAEANDLDGLERQLKRQQAEIEKLQAELEKQAALLGKLTGPQRASIPLPAGPRAATSRQDALEVRAANMQPVLPIIAVADKQAPDSPIVPRTATTRPRYNSGGEPLNPAVPDSPEAPIAVRIGKADFTPLGFLDATSFFRSANLGSGIGSAFGSAPFSNTPQGRLTETRLTMQNSRLGLMVDSTLGSNQIRGYWESDFLGAQPPNAFVTTNSGSFRVRLFWFDLRRGKFEFLAGQSWSMLTPNRVGISPMPSDLFISYDMDTNYQVGLTWARQQQFRFVYHASKEVTMGLSLENPEQYAGPAVVLPPQFNPAQVSTGAFASTPNLFPDVIGKIAFDGHADGKAEHIEVAGLMTQFKTYSSMNGSTRAVTGGGASVNFNFALTPKFHAILNTFYSDGGGRYIFGLGPAMIVHPDETPGLVHSASTVGGFEYTAAPGVLMYGYYGGAYYARTYDVIPTTRTTPASYVGFGFPGSPSSANKTIQEGTFGIIRTFWKNPQYGALQLITQYSYLTRAPWFVAINSPKNAHLGMAYADLRYVLP